MKILLGCEESQVVTKAFREKGHEAYSCDILPCSGWHPEWHVQDDVLKVMNGWLPVVHTGDCIFEDWDTDYEMPICPNCQIEYKDCNCPGPTQDGYEYTEFDNMLYARPEKGPYWDMMIAFPPCTRLTNSVIWYIKKHNLWNEVEESAKFFNDLLNANIEYIAVENPVQHGYARKFIRKYDQTIQPYDFGDDASKRTCLWLKNLPKLDPTDYVSPRIVDGKPRWGNQTDGGWNKLPPSKDRGMLRSKFWPGIAKAMADQWE